jgi:hypothetical protein
MKRNALAIIIAALGRSPASVLNDSANGTTERPKKKLHRDYVATPSSRFHKTVAPTCATTSATNEPLKNRGRKSRIEQPITGWCATPVPLPTAAARDPPGVCVRASPAEEEEATFSDGVMTIV